MISMSSVTELTHSESLISEALTVKAYDNLFEWEEPEVELSCIFIHFFSGFFEGRTRSLGFKVVFDQAKPNNCSL